MADENIIPHPDDLEFNVDVEERGLREMFPGVYKKMWQICNGDPRIEIAYDNKTTELK